MYWKQMKAYTYCMDMFYKISGWGTNCSVKSEASGNTPIYNTYTVNFLIYGNYSLTATHTKKKRKHWEVFQILVTLVQEQVFVKEEVYRPCSYH